MNNKKLNIDAYTQKLIQLSNIEEPSKDFTKGVMSKILKNPQVNISFITKEDKNSNLWLFLSMALLLVGYLSFYFIKNGFNIGERMSSLETPQYLKIFSDFFTNLFQELSLSPYIFIALLGVVILVVMDKTIIRFLYSI